MSTSVLITGGAGFIGSALARRLVNAGYDVAVLDILHPQVHGEHAAIDLPPSVRLFTGDVTHGPDLDAVLRLFQPAQIVHLAAETGTAQSLSEATRHGSVNVVGTTQLLDALSRAGHVPDQLVLASSRAVRSGDGAAVLVVTAVARGSNSRRVYAHAPSVPARTTATKIAMGMVFDVRAARWSS